MLDLTQKTAPSPSMPLKSTRPGYKSRPRGDGSTAHYWVAANVVRDTKNYPDKTIKLPNDSDDEEIVELCLRHTARLMAWLGRGDAGELLKTNYDGSFLSLSRVFQSHPESSFQTVKKNTQDFYVDSLKIIEGTIAQRQVRKCSIIDAKRWFRNWAEPAKEESPRRIKRAHDAIAMVRMICRFGAALGYEECARFVGMLANVRFERPGSRTEELTYQQAVAFVRVALEDNERDMAIAVAAQFELMLRQKDIIGEWTQAKLNTPQAVYNGKGKMWLGVFRWDNIPGWKLRIKTSKTRAATVFDLQDYPLLFPLLESVPMHEREGAMVLGHDGLPIGDRRFQKKFRKLARKAEIPDNVWNMDARAGGATEADEAGADIAAIQEHLTHATPAMTASYIRSKSTRRKSALAQARTKFRKENE